jgi:hypothetical protein
LHSTRCQQDTADNNDNNTDQHFHSYMVLGY